MPNGGARRPLAGGIALLIVWVAVSPAHAQRAPRLNPVDEAARNPEFLAFRTRLRDTIARRDAAALLAIVHPEIRNTFGGDNGIEGFKRLWRPDQPDTQVWRELDAVLSLGGTFRAPDSFVAPYVYARWPGDLDSFDYVAITGSNVRVRATADARGRILDVVTYALLRGFPGDPGQAWTEVTLADGRPGFVAARYVRSSVDYRAFFSRIDGRWLLTTLIAGD